MAFLALSNSDLQKEVHSYLFGTAVVPSLAEDLATVNSVINSGLRQFYSPPPVGRYAHEWSFLKPVTKRKLQAPYSSGGTATYDELTKTVSVTKIVVTGRSTSGTNTYTTATAHGFSAGDTIRIKSAVEAEADKDVIDIVSSTVFSVADASTHRISPDEGTVCYLPVPSWATLGYADLDGVSYPVASLVTADPNDGYKLVLDSNDNPGADITTAKSFKLHQDDYDLDLDFGRIVGNITFSEKDNAWHTIRIVGEARIRELRQRDYAASSSTDPILAAVSPKNTLKTSATGGDATHKIQFWPAITSSAIIHYRYEVRPTTLSADSDYPYGADDHSDTILYSCLSEAERRIDREAGVYKMRFMEALAASIEKDGRANRPELLGYNSDQSDGSGSEHMRTFGGQVRHKQQDGTFLE
tara:strand:+ start:5838 stop:7076 length:1239 start_codon:yes stop_codon:yes gene_type:complete